MAIITTTNILRRSVAITNPLTVMVTMIHITQILIGIITTRTPGALAFIWDTTGGLHLLIIMIHFVMADFQ